MAAAARIANNDPHIPVLLEPIIEAASPISGVWLDGTFGAGGYTRALLDAGASRVIAIDRDPMVFDMAAEWAPEYGDRLTLVEDTFSNLDQHGSDLDGVVLDLGVSSMQLDQGERGFSFMKDGPLDMRMGGGTSAAELVNAASETLLADILFHYGEERASRRIARAIVAARKDAPIETTAALRDIVEASLPRPKPGQSHPATRSFQAIRIAVNDEFGELAAGLEAAEKALKPEGWLAVVSFHSLEDRVVKRFFQARAAKGGSNRYAPEVEKDPAAFDRIAKPVAPSEAELSCNPRSRSARLRMGRRTSTAAGKADRRALGLPALALESQR